MTQKTSEAVPLKVSSKELYNTSLLPMLNIIYAMGIFNGNIERRVLHDPLLVNQKGQPKYTSAIIST